MKQLFYTLSFIFFIATANAQIADPVQWTYTAKKIADKTYELHITASLQNSWHLYSQQQPADAIAEPTTISFSKNPLIIIEGKAKEFGKMQIFKDEKLKISANQYSGKVDFVQKIKLKGNVKTNVVGVVEYQTCDDKKCLPPKKINFSIPIK